MECSRLLVGFPSDPGGRPAGGAEGPDSAASGRVRAASRAVPPLHRIDVRSHHAGRGRRRHDRLEHLAQVRAVSAYWLEDLLRRLDEVSGLSGIGGVEGRAHVDTLRREI